MTELLLGHLLDALAVVLAVVVLMYVLFAVGIQFFRGGWYKVLVVVLVPAFVLDLLLNYTLLPLFLWRRPSPGDHTISQTLGELYSDTGWRGDLAFFIGVKWLDPLDPRGQHVYGKRPADRLAPHS